MRSWPFILTNESGVGLTSVNPPPDTGGGSSPPGRRQQVLVGDQAEEPLDRSPVHGCVADDHCAGRCLRGGGNTAVDTMGNHRCFPHEPAVASAGVSWLAALTTSDSKATSVSSSSVSGGL